MQNTQLSKNVNREDEEFEYYLKLEKAHWNSLPNHTFYQLLEIFPEAKPAMKRGLLTNIKKYKADLDEAVLVEREGRKIIFNKTKNLRSQEFWLAVLDVFHLQPLRAGREKKIKQSRFYLSALKPKKASEVDPTKVTDEDIARAKEVPIESLIQVNHAGLAICPFHDDSRPSLHVYRKQNRWWCYVCAAGTDSIDLYMKLSKCDFLTAVRGLVNK